MRGHLIYNVYKPVGMTSRDVVNAFKHNLPTGFGKIGHLGTLDPFAEGVLLIATGSSTRLSDYLHAKMPKTYSARGVVGIKTNTGDLSKNSEVIIENNDDIATLGDLDLKICNLQLKNKFEGEYWQSPPSFSAAKHKGKALYKYAREGKTILKEKVKRHIYALEIKSIQNGEVDFVVQVSSGTYIRTLFEDMMQEIKLLGTLKNLQRISIGHISHKNALVQEVWPLRDNENNAAYTSKGTSMDKVLDFPKLSLQDEITSLAYRNGIAQNVKGGLDPAQQNLRWVYDHQEKLIGLGEIELGKLKVKFNLA